jgi:tRNA (guanine37-N1)-methyltransferase
VRIDVITLFPEIVGGALEQSILGRAQEKSLVRIFLHQLRDYATDKHRTVDDKPYGGGPGMLLKCDPVFAAVEAVQAMDAPGKVILFSPSGEVFNQSRARSFATESRLILLCGHYEGVDERVRENLAHEELSIGDYVLTNGAVAALVVIDSVVRLLPGALGNQDSAVDDSFAEGEIEGPQYTRPEEFRGWRVPEVLLSGNHAHIAAWRREQGRKKTGAVRPDLLKEEGKKI